MVIDNEGNCLACEHKQGKHTEAHDRVTKALSEVTSAMENLAIELELATGRSCLPIEGWSLMSGKLSVVMGNGGFRGIVMEEDGEGGIFSFKELLQELQNGELPRGSSGGDALGNKSV